MKRLIKWRVDLSVMAAYVLLTVAMTWPLILHLDTHFAGQNIDVWINQWATWWAEKAFIEGRSLYYTDAMFYPQGVSLAFHSFSHANTVLVILLRPWLGDLGAHNVTVMLAHILSGYAMFCLGRYLVKSTWGAFFAGLVFAFYPYRMAESVHPVLVSTQWIPLYLLFLIRLVEEGRRHHIIPTAIFAFLTALTSWHLLIFAIFISATYVVYLVLSERWRLSRATLVNLALLVGLIGILIAPFLYPLLREQLSTSRSYVGVELEDGAGNDPLAFVLPAEQHPVFRPLVIPWHARIKNTRAAYLGITVVGLSVFGSLKNWRRARFWVVLALTSMVLSLHPRLQIGGYIFDVAIPWSIPIVWLLRHPFRFNLVIGLAVAVTGGLGLTELIARLCDQNPRRRARLMTVATVMLLFEYLYFPFPLTPAVVSNYYAEISTTPASGAILDLPMGRDPARYYLYYQMLHGRPLIEGVVSRTSHAAYAFIEASPPLRALRACGDRALPPVDVAFLLRDLKALGIESVIVHKDLVSASALDVWIGARIFEPDYEDAAITVYHTDTEPADLVGVPQLLEGCIAVRLVGTEPIRVYPGAMQEVVLEWIVGNAPQEDVVLELALVDVHDVVRRRYHYEVVPGVSMMAWQTGKRHAQPYPLLLDSLLPAGVYQLQATLAPVSREHEVLLSAKVATLEVATDANTASGDVSTSSVNADYGADLRLLDYNLEASSDAIHLTFRWQAMQSMSVDYKFFVHLYAHTDAAPVAQVDMIPHNWTYPTSQWPVGRVVTDEVTFALDSLPARQYRLGIGVYHPQTGERLAISNAPDGFITDSGRLLLPEEITR